MNIDYTNFDQQSVQDELINYLKTTTTFKNVDVKGSTFNEFINLMSYNASLFGFYLNQIANEPFLDSAKIYKNLNRIANNLRYKPRGKGGAIVPVMTKLSKEYVLSNSEGFIEIPSYSTFPSTKNTASGERFSFTNPKPLVVPIKQFGVSLLKQNHLKYTGNVSENGSISSDRLTLLATKKNPFTILSEGGSILGTVENNIYSSPSDTLTSFEIDTEYTLRIRDNEDGTFSLLIHPSTTTVLSDEVAKFKVKADRTVTITKNYSVNRLYKGRLGIQNLEYVKFEAIPILGKSNAISKINMTIPRFSPSVNFLINGEVYSFSSKTDDITITTGDIKGGSFVLNEDMNIILNIGDTNAVNYGCTLELKNDLNLKSTDAVIARLPVNENTTSNGDLLIVDNEFTKGHSKEGYIVFEEGETEKRIVFKDPYVIGDGNITTISESSDKNYSIFISTDGNVRTFYSDKKTTGFTINLEKDTGFTGKVTWKTVSYERSKVQEEIQDLTSFQVAFDVTKAYSVMIQPSSNVNVWVSDTSTDGFKVSSDISFTGNVDFLIIPESELENSGDFSLAGTVFVPKSETEIQVTFTKPRSNSDYRAFLQPNGNVRVWTENKTNEGFIIRIEDATDFYGKIDWQIHESSLSGTLQFTGGNIVNGVPTIEYVDIEETSKLGDLHQGRAMMSVVDSNGIISTSNNALSLQYNTDTVIYPGLSFVIGNQNISYNNVRVFVKIGNTWVEFKNSDYYLDEIKEDSKVFHVRVNKDKKIGITFGDNDNRGYNPSDNQIAIIGLECVGIQGNITDGTLSNVIIGTLNFDTRNNTPLSVEKGLINYLKIQHNMFYENATYTSLTDYDGASVSTNDFSVVQLGPGVFGSEPELVEELRINSQHSYQSQNRLVSKSDYKTLISKQFSDIIIDLEVFNYRDAKDNGLLPSDSSIYNSNTLFFLSIPLYGTKFTLSQKEAIYKFIEQYNHKHATTGTVILEPTFIPIDVIILYSNKIDASPIDARNDITTAVNTFFNRKNRSLGEVITTDDIRNSIPTEYVKSVSIQLNKDPNNDYNSVDYDVDITKDQYQDTFKEVSDKKLQDAINTQLRTLLDKNLIQINQPLFDVETPDGKRQWIYSGEVPLGRFEFPILGDIVLERRV